MKRLLSTGSILLALIVGSIGLSACDNTIRGIGQDIRDTGDALEGN
ncbi:MAG: entericidin EcnA/B family protein [Pseudomonadota bacterium]